MQVKCIVALAIVCLMNKNVVQGQEGYVVEMPNAIIQNKIMQQDIAANIKDCTTTIEVTVTASGNTLPTGDNNTNTDGNNSPGSSNTDNTDNNTSISSTLPYCDDDDDSSGDDSMSDDGIDSDLISIVDSLDSDSSSDTTTDSGVSKAYVSVYTTVAVAIILATIPFF